MNYITDRATDHTTDCIITTEQLTKKYKNFTSVNNVSLHIRKGSIYGFSVRMGLGKIYHDENAFWSDQTDSWQLYH